MNCIECNERLDAYLDDTLSRSRRSEVGAHIQTCLSCCAALDSLRALRVATAALPREIAPPRDLWPEISARLGAPRSSRPALRFWIPFAAAAALGFAALMHWHRPLAAGGGWTVAALSGAPRLDARTFTGLDRWGIGQWLETDAASRARFEVGNIGEVRLEPNSRLRLVNASATDHRIELARGTMSALIWAPPRLFFVEIPSATAIDLGCAYTLSVDDRGASLLHVTSGYVALVHGDRESIIPAGLMCATEPGVGPGTPFAEDAPPALRAALQSFDFASGGDAALAHVLAEAGERDKVTLWHLLARATAAQRGAVFDKLAEFAPPPASVTRGGILAGNDVMLNRWAFEVGLIPSRAKLKK